MHAFNIWRAGQMMGTRVRRYSVQLKSQPGLTALSLSPQREKIREKFVAALKEEFAGKGLRFTKGEEADRKPRLSLQACGPARKHAPSSDFTP